MKMAERQAKNYYLPGPSPWPIIGSIALFCIMFGWFGTVIHENQAGLYDNKQLDRSFRWGMCWFIFSEVMFFGVFFGALFYVRIIVIPLLGGTHDISHIVTWPHFVETWPLLKNPNPSLYT